MIDMSDEDPEILDAIMVWLHTVSSVSFDDIWKWWFFIGGPLCWNQFEPDVTSFFPVLVTADKLMIEELKAHTIDKLRYNIRMAAMCATDDIKQYQYHPTFCFPLDDRELSTPESLDCSSDDGGFGWFEKKYSGDLQYYLEEILHLPDHLKTLCRQMLVHAFLGSMLVDVDPRDVWDARHSVKCDADKIWALDCLQKFAMADPQFGIVMGQAQARTAKINEIVRKGEYLDAHKGRSSYVLRYRKSYAVL
jgi:hypothetical protein